MIEQALFTTFIIYVGYRLGKYYFKNRGKPK